jgi:hypothetical protein
LSKCLETPEWREICKLIGHNSTIEMSKIQW